MGTFSSVHKAKFIILATDRSEDCDRFEYLYENTRFTHANYFKLEY